MERELNGSVTDADDRWFPPRFPSYVYFVQEGDAGPIKIGRASRAEARLARIQTGSSHELRLLCAVPGASVLERSFHVAFARDRLRGEWFRPTPELLRLVRELRRVWGAADRADAAAPDTK